MDAEPVLPPRKLNTLLKNKESFIYEGSLFLLIAIISSFLIILVVSFQAPKKFSENSTISFSRGRYVSELAGELKSKNYIHSELLFKLFLKLYGGDTNIKSGTYYFENKMSVAEMAHMFAVGDTYNTSIKVTIPEGSTVEQIARIINQKLPSVEVSDFVTKAKDKEGFLFPDTYFLEPETTAESIIKKLNDNYSKQTNSIIVGYSLNKKEENRLIILASLLEEEGKSETDRKIIAGILQRRLSIGMPLQVDATINYIKGRAGSVSFNDLGLNSPYNTYKNKGLPPGPISSPGLEAINDALTPTNTKYLYYLTGADGTFHYAVTFEEHVKNKIKYLK